MKKRILLISLTLLLIITVGCRNENSNDTDNTEELEKVEYEIGISPYDLSDENKDLLKTLSLEESNILSFNPPRTVKNIKANTYILEEDGTWKRTVQLNEEIENGYFDNDDVLKGTFAMIVDDVNTEKMTIKLKSTIRSLSRDKEEYQMDSERNTGDFVSSNVFLKDFENIELNKEIPVAIMVKMKVKKSTHIV